MTPRPARRLRVLAVAGAIAGARWAAADSGLTAEPTVQIVELAAGGSGAGSGAIVVRNTGSATVVASGIVAEPGCDAAAVHAAPLGGFMLMPGATQPITITCSPGPASMQRCGYQVRAAGNAVLLEFEAVCAYAGAPSLEPDLAMLDFGTVPVGGAASRTVALHNAAAAPINRLFVETTDLAGNFAVAAPCNPDARECDAAIPVLAAGATTAMVVTCTPRAPGPHTAELHLASSAGTRLTAPIALTCNGSPAATPVLSATPGALELGAVERVGTGQTATLHVANAGKGALRLNGIELLDGGTGAAIDWTVTPRGLCAAGVPPTCILGETEAADLDVAFEPRALGVRDATLVLDFRDTADRSISIPLHGIGAGPTLQVVGGPPALEFGTLPLGTAGALVLQVANHGTRNLGDGALAVSPAGPPFSISPSASLAVTTSATTPVTVTCTPAAAGSASAMLQLSAPDVAGPPVAIALHCAGDPTQALVATPPAVLLGEIRTATSKVTPIKIASTGAPIALNAADLELVISGLSVTGAPATTPAILDLVAAPPLEVSLDDHIIVKPTTGPPLALAIAGVAVTASYTAPNAISLGAFCVQQPTAPRIVALTSLGSGTIGLSAPALQNPDSPFDLAPVAPLGYPNIVAAGGRAVISVTPRRRAAAGMVADDVVWTTDVAGATAFHTAVTATFIDDGGAIAPGALGFGPTAIHVDARNAQQVTLQNCSIAQFRLDTPQVPAPFAIDSPSFPAALNPGELATFSVGFHPTKLGKLTTTLTITSPQLKKPLTVELSGEGVAPVPDGDAGAPLAGPPSTSFYACGGCATGDPAGALAIAVAVIGALAPRRRRPARRPAAITGPA